MGTGCREIWIYPPEAKLIREFDCIIFETGSSVQIFGEFMQASFFPVSFKPQISGHETFPLRYGWLKKAYDEVTNANSDTDNRAVFLNDDAIGRFGVGKNMVASIRHWAYATGILNEDSHSHVIRPTYIGKTLFNDDGLDPYMEHPTTLWLLHWKLASQPVKVTWYWAFNLCPSLSFDRDLIVNNINRIAKEQKWQRTGVTTIKNDVACFVRTYVSQQPSTRTGVDSSLECPLTELQLAQAVNKRNLFRFVRGPKATLGNGIFTYALIDFWSRFSKNSRTLSLEAISHAPGSPGRVFLLNETNVVDRLSELDKYTRGKLSWSETAGLKQVVREANDILDRPHGYIRRDYV